MKIVVFFSCVISLAAIPAQAQLPTCECQQEFTGQRLDLVKAPGHQTHPAGDADPITGNYFLLWQSSDPPAPGESGHTIRTVGRIFNQEGSPTSGEYVFESTKGVAGSNYSLPAAVIYNSRRGGFLVAWTASIFNETTQTYDRVELRGALISSNGQILIPPKKLLPMPSVYSVHQILFNRFVNQYVVLFSRQEYNKPAQLFVQRLNSSANPIGNRVQISSAKGQIDRAEIRLDPNTKRYAVSWTLSQAVSSSVIRIQIYNQSLERIGSTGVVANTNGYSPANLVYSGNKKAFVVFWNDQQNTFVRTINAAGQFLTPAMPMNISQYLTEVRTNPVDDGFIILRGRTPKATRVDQNFNVVERVLYPSCQAGDRNNPDLLIYNPAAREFLIVWTYSYWARDGAIEIHGRRLKAISSGNCE